MNSSKSTINNIILNNTTIVTYSCIAKTPGSFAIFLAFIACPVYILMLKILIHELRLSLPRHKILLSLNISDSIQIAGMGLLSMLGFISQANSNSTGCQVIRKLMEFVGIATVVSASGSVLLLAYERYVACVHCLRLYDIVTDNLVHRALYCIWAVAFISGFLDKELYEANHTAVALVFSKSTCIRYATVVLLSALVLTCVQVRLYLLSYKKINAVPAENSFGREAEENDTRKAQMKVAIVASAVVGLYMVCMCPAAFYMVFGGFEIQDDTSVIRFICIILSQVNTVVNPFVYGFGMVDTRKKIMADLKKLKDAIVNMVC